MPIQAPNEKPAIQHERASGLIDCAQSSAEAESDSSPGAVVERALAPADAAEIEPQHREAPMHELIVHLVDDLMVHRPAELRVRMQDDGDRGVLLACRVVAAFEPTRGAGEDDFGH